jgi:dTDP-4-amino-4,6-dideoxygalactose transaminase
VHRAPGTLGALIAGAVLPGDRVADFEAEAAAAFGAQRAVATGSGREALAMILRGLEVPAGAEVLLPALTFGAVPETIAKLGLVPVFVDADPETAQMDPDDLDRRLGPRSKVVIATHLMGHPCRIESIVELCEDRGMHVVEDFAQAAGATVGGKPVGSFGIAGFTSLETVKPLAAFGGGLITTRNHDLGQRLCAMAALLPRSRRRKLVGKVALGHVETLLARPLAFTWLGWPLMMTFGSENLVQRYKRGKKGAGSHHARLHPAQACVALASLRSLRAHVARRRQWAETLLSMLGEGPWRPGLGPDDASAWYQLVVRSSRADECARSCMRRGVDVGTGVLTDLSGGRCREAARLSSEAIQLPCHPDLDEDDLRIVARTVEEWLL